MPHPATSVIKELQSAAHAYLDGLLTAEEFHGKITLALINETDFDSEVFWLRLATQLDALITD